MATWLWILWMIMSCFTQSIILVQFVASQCQSWSRVSFHSMHRLALVRPVTVWVINWKLIWIWLSLMLVKPCVKVLWRLGILYHPTIIQLCLSRPWSSSVWIWIHHLKIWKKKNRIWSSMDLGTANSTSIMLMILVGCVILTFLLKGLWLILIVATTRPIVISLAMSCEVIWMSCHVQLVMAIVLTKQLSRFVLVVRMA